MPNPIDDNKKLAIAIGRAISHWAHAEVHLAIVFGQLTGMDHTMAVTVFRMLRSVPSQKEALLSVARVSIRCDEQDLATLSAILTDYGELAGKRNEIAHNPLGWAPGEEQKIYRMKREKVSKPGLFPYSRDLVKVADVEALTANIKTLVGRILKFHRGLTEKQLKAAGMNFSFPILPSQQRSSGQNPQSSGLLGDLKE
jgi:hypothetical protein